MKWKDSLLRKNVSLKSNEMERFIIKKKCFFKIE